MQVQAHFPTVQPGSLTAFDFVYTGPVLNPTDQLIIMLNDLQTGQRFEIQL